MIINEADYLAHYGILRRSGRYPWGSGGDAYQNHVGFLSYVDDLAKQGLSQTEIAKGLGISTTTLREYKAVAKNEIKQNKILEIERLKAKGMSNTAIGQQVGLPEATVRSWLKEGVKEKAQIIDATSTALKAHIEQKGFVDVGAGVEYQLGVSDGKLKQSIAKLRDEGYNLYYVKETQLGTGKETTIKVLAKPGISYSEVSQNRDKIGPPNAHSKDGGRTYQEPLPPLSISPKRVGVNYAEDGGAEADGVIYVRPGVKDVSLGGARYAQVRIAVGKDKYLKGMAMYKDDLPDGVDLVFNTNKSRKDAPNKLDTMKDMNKLEDGSLDVANPFGASISRQLTSHGKDGSAKVTSVMNIVNEEGDWSKWSKNLSSQMLSKQPPVLAKTQLNKAYEARLKEYERISQLTNPAVKKKLLETFGDEADSAAVHLKAAALGARQGTHVILPIKSMSPSEVYAPNYNNGERVVLIRYPHAGTFEIPELVVNNRHKEARSLLGDARDAIGIHSSVAERLSGADFDGDTVLVIPNNQNRIKTSAALKDLQGFDPRTQYKGYEGMPRMTARQKGKEMGDVSNLITDMTIKQASASEIARAVKHSMVVIDAEKHGLNWKLSAEQNGIKALKEKYQGGPKAGAATLISRAGGIERVPQQIPRRARDGGPIDKETGKRVFTPTGESYVDAKGKVVVKTTKAKRLSVYDDAHDLVSEPTGTPIERLYADHSNRLKALANQARKESVNIPPTKYSPSARKVYEKEVSSLNAQLALAKQNAPYERQAQLIGNATYKQKLAVDPNMDETTKKKVKAQAINEARNRVGARKIKIDITDTEWEAIQAGALHDTRLKEILSNADLDRVKELATPKPQRSLTSAKASRAQQMLNAGATRAEVANALGVSLTTLDAYTDAKGGENLD